jgi:hypothetical protein
MDFFGAMESLKEGKRVRVKSWDSNNFIELVEEEMKKRGKRCSKYSVYNQHDLELSPIVSFSVLLSAEWELYDDEAKSKLAKKIQKLLED